MRWVWNSSVIPNVGNTRSQPESAISSVGYPILSTLRSKLPLGLVFVAKALQHPIFGLAGAQEGFCGGTYARPILYAEGSMATGYVEQREGGYYIVGSRVSLDSVVYAFLRGESPEGIVESFPALSLEQVFGTVAFYLANRESIDAYLRDGRVEFARMRDEARRKHPALYSKLEATRHGAPSSSA